jgi:SAM-dependent methyltransferase
MIPIIDIWRRAVAASLAAGLVLPGLALAQTAAPPAGQSQPPAQSTYEPKVGQAGKDVVWVPSPETTVEKMLDVAKVTPQDFVVDLGSGDGRNVIAAAKRGAKALGVEFNPDMVELSKRNAQKAGVADRASFVQGDMYEAEFSQATVLALFLLPENLRKLTPKFAALKPGTRIVANTFGISGWTPDETEKLETDCTNWCTALLWIVPAKAAGAWTMPEGAMTLQQEFQMVTGALTSAGASKPITGGRLRGDAITFTVDGAKYEGRVTGNTIAGTVTVNGKTGPWRATRS